MKIFLDTNAVIDALLPQREDFNTMVEILKIVKQNRIDVMTTGISLATAAYVISAQPDEFRTELKIFCKHVEIASVTDWIVDEALQMDHSDFEDAVQLVCAATNCCDVIITRDKHHFTDKYTTQDIFTPAEFLARAKEAAACSRQQ